jgi:hypothetical protein
MLRAFSSRNFSLFYIGQAISLIGTSMTQVATSWLVYRLTDSALLLGVVGFASQIPTLLLIPLVSVVNTIILGASIFMQQFSNFRDLVRLNLNADSS